MTGRALAITAVLVVTACGGGTSVSRHAATSSGLSGVTAIAAEVPSEMRALAPFQIATDATYPPNEFVNPDTGAIEGWEVDLGDAICKVMGVACTFNNLPSDDIIAELLASNPGEIAGGDKPRYQFSIASWSPTVAREERGIDFIDYYVAGEAWIDKTDGPAIGSAIDMCGRTVAVEAVTSEESDAWGFMGRQVGGNPIAGDRDNCQAAGRPDINVLSFTTLAEVNDTLLSGGAGIAWLDQPVADYEVKQSRGSFKLGGSPCSLAPYGIALLRGSALEKPIMDAVRYLIDNNDYRRVLDSWGVAGGAIASSDVSLNNNSSIGQSCVPSY